MGYCSKCGVQLPEDAYFCPKCGYKTGLGMQAGVFSPYESMRETFVKVGQEMEKAFETAAREVEKAFEVARKSIEEAAGRNPKTCSGCGERNAWDSRFCYKCGKSLD
ncbi:MAG: zinc-ribbon domain-containing protein [Nitrososphaeria archaeon]